MSVLLEALSVIVRHEAIVRNFRGGWAGFEESIPNQTFCSDGDLVRVGFMAPQDVAAYVATLEAAGLVFQRDSQAIDIAVVDQLHGPTVPAPWLEFGTVQRGKMKVKACWLLGTSPQRLALPRGWTFEGSLSDKPGFSPDGSEGDRHKFLRRENGFDVYLDLRTGKEAFVARPSFSGDEQAVLVTQLESICHEALNLEAQIQPLEALGDKEGILPFLRLLQNKLLPEVERITKGPGKDKPFPHFSQGLILRILRRREEAEHHFRISNELQPGVVNTLRELVRCLAEQGKHKEALTFAREGVKAGPVDAGAWGNLAMCLIECGNRDEARKAIDFAMDLDPQDPINRTIRDNFERYFLKKEESVESLIAYCREKHRVCPNPTFWNDLWKMLPESRGVGAGWEPPAPLILAAWHHAPNLAKMIRLDEHIKWAEKHGALEKVAIFLRGLKEEDWHHLKD